MILPTDIPAVGLEGGGGESLRGERAAAVLEVPVEWNEFCSNCLRWTKFVAVAECAEGLFCECTGCGEARIAPWSRMNSEVA